jgi:hypothetical protein
LLDVPGIYSIQCHAILFASLLVHLLVVVGLTYCLFCCDLSILGWSYRHKTEQASLHNINIVRARSSKSTDHLIAT